MGLDRNQGSRLWIPSARMQAELHGSHWRTLPRPARPAQPPVPPPIDQNPYNGPHPVPAPDMPGITPVWTAMVGAAGLTSTTVSAVAVTSQGILDGLAIAIFTPVIVGSPDPRLQPEPGGNNKWRTRTDGQCDDGPGRSANGHHVYLPRERYFDTFTSTEQCRATGVYGIIDKQDLTTKAHPGPGTDVSDTYRPPGYDEINSQHGQRAANNGHLIPKIGGGSGTDLRNLVAQYRWVNSPYIRDTVEKEMRTSIEAGKRVTVSIVPHYDRSDTGIPTRIEYNYSEVGSGEWKHCTIWNNPGKTAVTTGTPNCPQKK